ncbi:MAG: TetR/AcrR family transcriptional regulator [Bacteroidales bacterium]
MDKKELQEQRIRGYFIQAAKEMLKGEGLKSINVRAVAERAGYSFATLYNYFRDVKDLVFLCVKDFQDECQQYVESESKKVKRGNDKIKAISLAYLKYFIQYPGIFELFFLEKVNDIGQKQPTIELIYTFLDRLTAKEWDYMIKKKLTTQEKAETTKIQLHALITGLLLFYLNRREPANYTDFMKLVNTQLDHTIYNTLHS